jgi:hypothetical protein
LNGHDADSVADLPDGDGDVIVIDLNQKHASLMRVNRISQVQHPYEAQAFRLAKVWPGRSAWPVLCVDAEVSGQLAG